MNTKFTTNKTTFNIVIRLKDPIEFTKLQEVIHNLQHTTFHEEVLISHETYPKKIYVSTRKDLPVVKVHLLKGKRKVEIYGDVSCWNCWVASTIANTIRKEFTESKDNPYKISYNLVNYKEELERLHGKFWGRILYWKEPIPVYKKSVRRK